MEYFQSGRRIGYRDNHLGYWERFYTDRFQNESLTMVIQVHGLSHQFFCLGTFLGETAGKDYCEESQVVRLSDKDKGILL